MGSFLVRVREEPRERDGEPRPIRFYVRNLRTGEEQYLTNASKLGESLLRQARARRDEAGAGDEPVRSRAQ